MNDVKSSVTISSDDCDTILSLAGVGMMILAQCAEGGR